MTRQWRFRRGAIVLTALLAACGDRGAAPDPDKPMHLRFEDAADPAAFSLEAPAVRGGAEGAAGLWAAVPGLNRPERARLVNPATGAAVVVALFARRDGPIRLSAEAADALGIGDRPATVRVTALRSRPELDTTTGRF